MLDTIIFEAQLNVHNALLDSYEKSYMLIEEGADPSIIGECIFMESETKSEETPKKKVGIIRRIIDAIKRLISNIADFFRKKFGKKSTNDAASGKTQLTESQENASTVFETIIHELEKINDAVHSNDYSLKIEDISFPYDLDFSQITKNEADNLCRYAKTVIGTIDAKVDEMNPVADEKMLKAFGSYAREINSILAGLSKALIKSEKENNKNWTHKFRTSETSVVIKRSAVDPEHLSEFDSLVNDAITLRKTKDFSEYTIAFNRIISTLGFPPHSVIVNCSLSPTALRSEDPYFLVRIRPDRLRSIKLKKGSKLYHTSPVGGLTELKPSFKTLDGVDSLYPDQRVYFFIDNPGHRFDTSNTGKFKVVGDDNIHVYEYTGDSNITMYEDPESGTYRKSVYIRTKEPLPVREVTDNFLQNKSKE